MITKDMISVRIVDGCPRNGREIKVAETTVNIVLQKEVDGIVDAAEIEELKGRTIRYIYRDILHKMTETERVVTREIVSPTMNLDAILDAFKAMRKMIEEQME